MAALVCCQMSRASQKNRKNRKSYWNYCSRQAYRTPPESYAFLSTTESHHCRVAMKTISPKPASPNPSFAIDRSGDCNPQNANRNASSTLMTL